MSIKPVIPRAGARRDVEEAVDYYAEQAGTEIALRFVDAVRDAYRAISSRPGVGSPRYAHELELPGLRSRRITRFPYFIFYVERDDHIDVWRILHSQRDIPSWISDDGA